MKDFFTHNTSSKLVLQNGTFSYKWKWRKALTVLRPNEVNNYDWRANGHQRKVHDTPIGIGALSMDNQLYGSLS